MQYALPLSLPPVFSADNYFLSACNETAYRQVMAWPDWPAHALLLTGESGAGKTHLGTLWAQKSHAAIIEASALDADNPPPGNALVENIERAQARALLHLYNYSRENGHFLLLTGSAPPRQLPFTLPDLTSRLLALPQAQLGAPDDALLAGVLRKHFADRQLKVEEEVIVYLAARMERALGGIPALVEKLDARAIAERKALTVPFVRRVMGY